MDRFPDGAYRYGIHKGTYMIGPVELMLAFALDSAVGDPRRLPHPVRLIGGGIVKAERILRARFNERLGGVMLALIITGLSFLATYAVYKVLRLPSEGTAEVVCAAVLVYLVSTTLALKDLITSVKSVLHSGGLEEARLKLSRIVGRDTEDLDEEGVTRAAIETLAENTSDGVIAPLFYLAVGGLPLAVAYKAVNTLDSMVGYKNERYKEFGRASARLDDVFNYLPARLTGILMVLSTVFLSDFTLRDTRHAFRIMLRDGRQHTSPNSGIPEAAMAGALGIRLGGPSRYGGVPVEKPFMGEKGLLDRDKAGEKAMKLSITASCLGLVSAASAIYLGTAL